MSETTRQLLETTPPTASLQTPPGEVELEVALWDEAEFFDDDSLATIHAGVAEGLLEEYARSEAQQQARDELAVKVLNLITSVLESPFSDASRKMELVNQLVSRIGHLCNGGEVQKAVEKYSQEKKNFGSKASKVEADEDEEEYPHSFAHVPKRAGGLVLKSLLKSLSETLRKWFMPFSSKP